MEDKLDDQLKSDTDYYEKPLSKIFADSIKITTLAKERKRLHKKRSPKQDEKKRKNILNSFKKEPRQMYLNQEQDSLEFDKLEESTVILKEKFETVIFTEDEMLKCREEKVNQANYKKIPYKCSSCVTGFTKKENYELHLKKLHNEVSSCSAAVSHGRMKHAGDEAGKILCPFLSSRIHSTKREFSCSVCLKTFTSSNRLESHSACHNNSAAYCTHCSTQYKDIQEYRNYLWNNKNHVQDRMSCPACNRQFASRVYCTKHYNFYHLKRSRYKCEDCDKSKATLLTHALVHAPRAFMCAVCGAAFTQPAALYTHIALKNCHNTNARILKR